MRRRDNSRTGIINRAVLLALAIAALSFCGCVKVVSYQEYREARLMHFLDPDHGSGKTAHPADTEVSTAAPDISGTESTAPGPDETGHSENAGETGETERTDAADPGSVTEGADPSGETNETGETDPSDVTDVPPETDVTESTETESGETDPSDMTNETGETDPSDVTDENGETDVPPETDATESTEVESGETDPPEPATETEAPTVPEPVTETEAPTVPEPATEAEPPTLPEPVTETEAPTVPETQPVPVHLDVPAEGMDGYISGIDYSQYLPVPASVSHDVGGYPEYLAYGAFFQGNTSVPAVYLTFTIGTEEGNTSAILDVLDAYNVKAVFFISIDEFLRSDGTDTAALLRRIVSSGHVVGCHGYTHTNTVGMSDVRFVNEILLFKNRLSEVLGYDYNVKLYCPPHETPIARDMYLSRLMGLQYVMPTGLWPDTAADYTLHQAFQDMLNHLQNGFVYLLHTKPANALALGTFIETARNAGYTFLTVQP